MTRMRNIAMAAVLAAAGVAAAEEGKPEPKLSAEAAERGAHHVFAVRGEAPLQDGERVEIRVCYVRRWKLPPALVQPGGPDFEEELIDVDRGTAEVAGGAFESTLGHADLAPWPGDYRVFLFWEDDDSEEDPPRAAVGLKLGKPEDLPALRARCDREVYEDFARLGRVLAGVEERWKALADAPDPTWADFRRNADRKIAAVRTRNAKRRKAEIYWLECRGRQRIDWILQRIVPLLDAGNIHIARPAAERPAKEDFVAALADTREDYDYYLEFLGIGKIIDDLKVDAALRAFRTFAANLEGWAKRLPADKAAWAAESTDVRTGLLEAQMALTAELPEAYFSRAESVQKAALRLVEHLDALAAGKAPSADWEGLRKGLEEASRTLEASVPRVKEE
jgi:hypothetical protein